MIIILFGRELIRNGLERTIRPALAQKPYVDTLIVIAQTVFLFIINKLIQIKFIIILYLTKKKNIKLLLICEL